MMMRAFLVLIVGTLVSCSPLSPRLSSQSYERIISLSRTLDSKAVDVISDVQASDSLRRDRRLVDALEEFARRARDFRIHVSSHNASTQSIEREVGDLLSDAREVDRELSVQREGRTYDDWRSALDVLREIDDVSRDDSYESPHRDIWDDLGVRRNERRDFSRDGY